MKFLSLIFIAVLLCGNDITYELQIKGRVHNVPIITSVEASITLSPQFLSTLWQSVALFFFISEDSSGCRSFTTYVPTTHSYASNSHYSV